LKVESAEMARDVNDFTDEVEAWDIATFHGLR
jgi:hypothetical protein